MLKRMAGQSTVEFLVTFIFVLGILFLFIKMAMNATAGFVVHYAVFMSSRTYLVMDNGSREDSSVYTFAEEMANKQFDKFKVGRFLRETKVAGGASGQQGGEGKNSLKFNSNIKQHFREKTHRILVGTYFKFQQKLSFFSIVGGTKRAEMISESFLGKEPTRTQCLERICKVLELRLANGLGKGYAPCGDATTSHETLFDNGC